MKRIAVILTAVVFVLSIAVVAAAAGTTQTGTIKSVDAKAGTIVFMPDGGRETTLNVDKSVDLGKVKPGSKATITMENDVVTSIKAKRREIVGC